MFKNKFLIIIFTTLLVAVIGINHFLLKDKFTIPSDFSDKAVIYTISSSGEYPRFLKAIIDPEDVKPGDIQKMLIEVEGPDDIEQVKAEIEHDEGIDEVVLALKDGDEKHGQWFGIWEVHSTHSETYRTTFIAKDKTGKTNKIVLAWTDACVPPRGGDWTLDGNCSISGVNGVDNGNFTIDGGYTLTINADGVFVRNSGKAITITNGSIAICTGGELKETNLWMIDGDSDNYPTGTTQYSQDSAPTSGRRRYLVTGSGTDCDDSDNTKYENLTCYADSDSDTYYSETGTSICSGASCPTGYSGTVGTDCCDSDNRAYPGESTYYSSPNNCSSWDYDCDGQTSKSGCSGAGRTCQVSNYFSCSPAYPSCTGSIGGYLGVGFNSPAPEAACGGQQRYDSSNLSSWCCGQLSLETCYTNGCYNTYTCSTGYTGSTCSCK